MLIPNYQIRYRERTEWSTPPGTCCPFVWSTCQIKPTKRSDGTPAITKRRHLIGGLNVSSPPRTALTKRHRWRGRSEELINGQPPTEEREPSGAKWIGKGCARSTRWPLGTRTYLAARGECSPRQLMPRWAVLRRWKTCLRPWIFNGIREFGSNLIGKYLGGGLQTSMSDLKFPLSLV